MNRTETIALIAELLATKFADDGDCPDCSAAEQVFEQMPVTLAELRNSPTALGEAFEELVRLASHDVAAAMRAESSHGPLRSTPSALDLLAACEGLIFAASAVLAANGACNTEGAAKWAGTLAANLGDLAIARDKARAAIARARGQA